jgi:hypothetical protein
MYLLRKIELQHKLEERKVLEWGVFIGVDNQNMMNRFYPTYLEDLIF